MKRERANYLGMIAALSPSPTRAVLLTMDLSALRLDDQVRRASLKAPPVLPHR
jgi:hypothetical protein